MSTKSRWLLGGALLVSVIVAYAYGVLIPREAIYLDRWPLTTSPADVGVEFEDIVLRPSDTDLELQGWWMPAKNAKATMAFIHGGSIHRDSEYFGSLKFYRAMIDNHISVVAIDLRNHGKSGGDGRGLQWGRTEKYDALAAIDWARGKTPGLPLFAMGKSMGGATVIHAASAGAKIDGLILLDPLLHSYDAFMHGAWVGSGLPPALFLPAAWAATTFHGLPGGDQQALELAAGLDLPILTIQDPEDPLTRAPYAHALAERNKRVTLWMAPGPGPDQDLSWKGRWGSHVAAFYLAPAETVAQVTQFIDRHSSGRAANLSGLQGDPQPIQ